MAALKKLHQQRVPANPFGPILGALPEVVGTDVAVRAQVAVDLVNFGVQDGYDNIALHLFISSSPASDPTFAMKLCGSLP
jgi:hypothetical protein